MGDPAQPPPKRPTEEEDGDASERRHFLEVCWSCLEYLDDAKRDVKRMERAIANLDPADKALWHADHKKWMATLQVGAQANTAFLKLLPSPDVCGAPMSAKHAQMVYRTPPGHHVEGRNSSKVRTTLRQFVRDWAVEGKPERDSTYAPLIEAVQRHLPLPKGGGKGGYGGKGGNGGKGKGGFSGKPPPKPKVLCPGSGLGRLPFDFAWLGYAAQGNEFSYHMILGSHLIYNRTDEPLSHLIYPFLFSTMNRTGHADNLKPIKIPDVVPCLALNADSDISMAAGEFVAVYEDQKEEWDAVVTAFFLDTAKNIFLYIRTIASILRPGGLFINLGPLLFHYADVEHETSRAP
jgi:hypothetical protein